MAGGILITDAAIMTPHGVWPRGWMLTEGRRIARIGCGDAPAFDVASTIRATGLLLLPGFIDIHVHGALGADTMDAAPESLHCMAQFYAQHGVTAFLATTWTDSDARIRAALETIAGAVGPQPDGATLLGAHLEGPYLNPAKCGAQITDHIRRATPDEARPWLDLGAIRLVALAPEFDANHWLIGECVRRGVAVSAAHTAATYDQMQHAVCQGITQTTHTFNAMTGLHHRDPGVVGAALSNPHLRCELIADGIHVHPAAMQIIYAAKGPEHVMLITDAVSAAGLPDGDHQIDGRPVTVSAGAVRLPDGTLAGSTLTMDRALRNFQQATGAPLAELWRATSLNPARAIGVSDRKGSLETGKDADLVLLDSHGAVRLTVAEGRIVFRDNV